MSPLCCICGQRNGHFCRLCRHHICEPCGTDWRARGVAAWNEKIHGDVSKLFCDHPRGERGDEAPEA